MVQSLATGLQKGGIYRHFSSKEALAAAAILSIACRGRTPTLSRTKDGSNA